MTSIFEEVFRRSPVALLVVDASRRIVHLNRFAGQLFGYEPEELVGERIEALMPKAHRDRHPALVEQYLANPMPRQMDYGRELSGIRKDGGEFPIEVGLSPLQRDGETMVLASVVDVSGRRMATERFRAAFDAAPNGMLMIRASGEIVLCNRQVERIFGYSRDELIGLPVETLVPVELESAHRGFVAGYLRDPEPRAMGAGRELYGEHKSGRPIPVEIGLQPMESDGAMFVISSVVDISTRRDAVAEIRRKTSEIDEFAYRTSHDLRSPLKSIAAITDCIAEDLQGGDLQEASEGVQSVGFLVRKLLTLTTDLLTLTKVDNAVEHRLVFDFEDYAKGATVGFYEALHRANTELRFDFKHVGELETQSARLTQVLNNLVGNGIKYGDPKKDGRYVLIRTSTESNHLVIEVEDNGMGIDPAYHDSVFGMFKRFHSAEIPGSGLGLYLVKKQVALLGAEISFRSDPSGTTFVMRVPLEV